MNCDHRGKTQRGFLSLEVMATLIVMVAGMAISMQWIARDFDQRANQIAAQHAQIFADATANYIKANYSTVKAAAAPLATYAAANLGAYVPSSLTATNNYGQSYSVRVYNNGSVLQTMIVTSGGDTISEASIRDIASQIGAAGGYISSSNTALAQGTQGGWSMGFGTFGATPGAGKIAVALFFQDGAQVSDYLYRNVVAGHPELNRMGTGLDMGGNPITNASTVSAGQIGTNGLSPSTGYPGGWVGGIHALNIYAEGTIGAGTNGALNAYVSSGGTVYGNQLTSTGNVDAAAAVNAGNVNVSGTVGAGGTVSGGSLVSATEVTAQNWLRTNGSSGWYSNAWGGGWFMQDSTWVRSYADKNVYTGGTMMAGNIRSIGRMQADEYLDLRGTATAGTTCSPNALVAQDGVGGLLTCRSGVWTATKEATKVASQRCKNGTSSSGGTNVACSICLPSQGTYHIMAQAYGYQAGWLTAQLYINNVLVDSNSNHGDQAGTGYGIMSGVRTVTGSGCVPLRAFFNYTGGDTDAVVTAIAVGL